ncbi:MAG: hypothetical protein PHU85_03535 [Phycisphaerae bacterium]|nr:hypothetical protein [Phycisphaerae bacterium]
MGSKKWLILATVPLMVLALAVVASAQPAPNAADIAAQTQSRLLAKRAAEADAYRKMAEQVRGLRITSTTFVKDFVAENDDIATSVDTFLRGCKIIDSQTRFMEDNSCEVTMELALATVEAELTRIYQAKYKGDKYKINDFQDLHVTNKIEKVSVKGTGAPRPVAGTEDPVGPITPPVGTGLGLPPEWKGIPAQGRLMAKRAAELDAYRRLTEQVMGLRISSSTFVRDFVAESDDIRTDLNTFIKGVKLGEPRYNRDLSVTVEAKVALATVITELTREYEAHYKGDKYKIRDFQNIKQEVKIDWVTAEGQGVVPAKYLGGVPVVPVTPVDTVPPWAKETIKATGNGVKPATAESDAQGRLMALRAARLDAMRKLSEQINGLRISSTTLVKDFVAEHDQIVTDMDTWLKGVKEVGEGDYNAATGEAKVTVEVPLEPLWDLVVKYRKTVTIERRVN